MNTLLVILGALALVFFLLTRYLRGESLARYDTLPGHWAPTAREASAQHFEVVNELGALLAHATKGGGNMAAPGKSRLTSIRALMDAMGDDVDLTGITITPVDAGGVPAEWVVADGGDPDRRLLYIHGGAWMMGSPKSHRRITTRFARITGGAVLVIDYRLIPEHSRLACVEDCQAAYRWILDNGPKGKAPVRQLMIAGDSAGGNLTLVTIAWARDQGLRPVDAAVALAPATDGTLSSPSLLSNIATDHLIGPMFGFLAKFPPWLLLWGYALRYKIRPSNPLVSPAHHDLSGLPPTLVHVSEAEMLFDDARRYVNKATQAGSPANLETWPHMLHVWHFFEHKLPEAQEAFAHIERYLETTVPRGH